jgi:hypothetical protein
MSFQSLHHMIRLHWNWYMSTAASCYRRNNWIKRRTSRIRFLCIKLSLSYTCRKHTLQSNIDYNVDILTFSHWNFKPINSVPFTQHMPPVCANLRRINNVKIPTILTLIWQKSSHACLVQLTSVLQFENLSPQFKISQKQSKCNDISFPWLHNAADALH